MFCSLHHASLPRSRSVSRHAMLLLCGEESCVTRHVSARENSITHARARGFDSRHFGRERVDPKTSLALTEFYFGFGLK